MPLGTLRDYYIASVLIWKKIGDLAMPQSEPIKPSSANSPLFCECASSGPLSLAKGFSKPTVHSGSGLAPAPGCTGTGSPGLLFFLLPPLENFFPSSVIDVRRRHIADPLDSAGGCRITAADCSS
jgi:hypothetical protein